MQVLFAASAAGLDTSSRCSRLAFEWTADAPYDHVQMEAGVAPLSVYPGCAIEQSCLFFNDKDVRNLALAADGQVFPVFENTLSSSNPSMGRMQSNGNHVYDEHSQMFIAGVGLYTGPEGIVEYRLVPRFAMRASNEVFLSIVATPDRSFVSTEFVQGARWFHFE